jgi:hypothetical protein
MNENFIVTKKGTRFRNTNFTVGGATLNNLKDGELLGLSSHFIVTTKGT